MTDDEVVEILKGAMQRHATLAPKKDVLNDWAPHPMPFRNKRSGWTKPVLVAASIAAAAAITWAVTVARSPNLRSATPQIPAGISSVSDSAAESHTEPPSSWRTFPPPDIALPNPMQETPAGLCGGRFDPKLNDQAADIVVKKARVTPASEGGFDYSIQIENRTESTYFYHARPWILDNWTVVGTTIPGQAIGGGATEYTELGAGEVASLSGHFKLYSCSAMAGDDTPGSSRDNTYKELPKGQYQIFIVLGDEVKDENGPIRAPVKVAGPIVVAN